MDSLDRDGKTTALFETSINIEFQNDERTPDDRFVSIHTLQRFAGRQVSLPFAFSPFSELRSSTGTVLLVLRQECDRLRSSIDLLQIL